MYVALGPDLHDDSRCRHYAQSDLYFRTASLRSVQSQKQNVSTSKNVLEGIWWRQGSNVSGFVSLANTSSEPVSATVQLNNNHRTILGTHRSIRATPPVRDVGSVPKWRDEPGTRAATREATVERRFSGWTGIHIGEERIFRPNSRERSKD
jgi:hypothetical protein